MVTKINRRFFHNNYNRLRVVLSLERVEVLGRNKAGLVSGVWVLLLFLAVFGVVLKVPLVESNSGTIYIRADGSIDPPTANITRTNNATYYFANNIYDEIVVQRDNIVVDGAGYTLHGTGADYSKGIDLSYRSNVTISNVKIRTFYYGIWLDHSSSSGITGNNITSNRFGIRLDESLGNSLSGNSLVNNTYGIDLAYSSNNNLYGNKIKDSGFAIDVGLSPNNIISKNSITNNSDGVRLGSSNDNTLFGNNITANSDDGVYIEASSNNTLFGNDIANNYAGITLEHSPNNSISGNNIKANKYWGIDLSWFCPNNTLRRNNITNNKNGIGLFYASSSFNEISGNNITANSGDGIYLEYSPNNNISGNNIAKNECGISLGGTNNSITGNDITNNNYGICLWSSNNRIYHNNFIDNYISADIYVVSIGVNYWDDRFEGNYWSEYTGTDTDYDGIGNNWYEIDDDNIDHYPLMGLFSDFSIDYEETYHVTTICNSSISDFEFNGTAISFNVSGENDTTGFCRICIPTALMNVTYTVFVNGTEVSYNLLPFSDETYSYLYFNYTHSAQEVVIIPEFPSFLVLPIFMIAALLAVIVYKKREV